MSSGPVGGPDIGIVVGKDGDSVEIPLSLLVRTQRSIRQEELTNHMLVCTDGNYSVIAKDEFMASLAGPSVTELNERVNSYG